jgi:DNA polymerase III subunit epsilon
MKAIFIDTETTGLDPITCGVVQIAGFIEINNAMVETFNFHCRPFPDDKIHNEALVANGLTREVIATFDAPDSAYHAFTHLLQRYVNKYEKTDKFHWYGYNAPFDSEFMREWFKKNGDKYFGSFFFHPPIDIMNLAGYVLREERPRLPKFNLSSVATYLKVPLEEGSLHDAVYDVKIMKSVLVELERRLIPGVA